MLVNLGKLNCPKHKTYNGIGKPKTCDVCWTIYVTMSSEDTLEKLLSEFVNRCEDLAEGANYHNFVEMYSKIEKLLRKHTNLCTTVLLMREIFLQDGFIE